ncbi:MAG TPA: hypothetical protein VNZ86_02515 [Bacteroidia bacterium]|jgi:hypothetical protein|nr:hypothetical protein [Bacteroidia bacterium]
MLIGAGTFAQSATLAAQSKTHPVSAVRTNCTIYHYSFIGASSLAEVDSLSTEMYQIPEVTQFKASFKSGNKHAEIMLVVVEKFPYRESPGTFDAVRLKTIILNHGYQPLDLTSYCVDR